MKTWFKVQSKTDTTAEVSIYDDIGAWGVSAKDFINALKPHAGKRVLLSINSPGGSVFDALAMYNALRSHQGGVDVKIMGVAASAASLIAMAGEKITMPANTFMMIHNPWAMVAGNADEMRDFADTLDTIGTALVNTYVKRTGLDEAEVRQMLAEETWLTAQMAVDKGFATEVEDEMRVAASFDVERLPEDVRQIFDSANEVLDETPQEPVQEDLFAPPVEETAQAAFADAVLALAKTAGVEQFAATIALSASVKTLEDAVAKIAHVREVIALCALAGKPAMAAAMITDNKDFDAVRATLCETLADEADTLNVQNHLPTQSHPNAGGASVWAKIFPQTAV